MIPLPFKLFFFCDIHVFFSAILRNDRIYHIRRESLDTYPYIRTHIKYLTKYVYTVRVARKFDHRVPTNYQPITDSRVIWSWK